MMTSREIHDAWQAEKMALADATLEKVRGMTTYEQSNAWWSDYIAAQSAINRKYDLIRQENQ